MAIRDISLGTARPPHQRAFNFSTWAIAQLYTAYLPAFNSGGIAKVFVGVHDTAGAPHPPAQHLGPVKRLLNVAQVDVMLDLSWYTDLPELTKAELQLELLHAACIVLAAAQH